MTHDTRASKLLAALFATVAIVAACSSSGGGATTAPSVAVPSASASQAAPSASEAAPSESASASAAAGAIELKLATGALGSFLTADLLVGPVFYRRLMTAEPYPAGDVARIVHAVLPPRAGGRRARARR